jgi:putative transposase
MRQARIRGQGLSYYHIISRVVDRRFILGDEEREHFVVLMRKLEAFLGVRVVTYVVMSNHFHLLIEEPDRDNLPAKFLGTG